jgi:DNA-binding NarL/FixJ family response regulator
MAKDVVTKPTVMFADDDPALLESLQKLLEPYFKVAASVRDGQTLLEAAQALTPDVIIADISMPVLNGFQAARRLKALQPNARILFLTIHEDPAFVAEARKCGACGYVVKRCAPTYLIPAIHEALRGCSFFCPCATDDRAAHAPDHPRR